MMNYYDELKNDTEEALKYDYAEDTTGKEDASGSYYNCYDHFKDVFEALEDHGYLDIKKN